MISLVQQVPSCWWILTLYFTQFEMRPPMKGTICSSLTSLRTWWVSAWFWPKVSSEFVLTLSKGRKDDGHLWQGTHEQHHAIFKSAAIFGVPLQKIACLSISNPWGHTSVQPTGRLGAFTNQIRLVWHGLASLRVPKAATMHPFFGWLWLSLDSAGTFEMRAKSNQVAMFKLCLLQLQMGT